MESAAEHALQIVAVLVILIGLLQFLLLGTTVGIFALFVADFAFVRAFYSGATLLALDFLRRILGLPRLFGVCRDRNFCVWALS